MTIPDEDPIVRGLKTLHESETARATRDLAQAPGRLGSPVMRSSLPRLLPIGIAVVVVGVLASAVFVGGGSRSGGAAVASASPGSSLVVSPAPSSVPSAAPSSSPQHAQAQEGRFQLDFDLPKGTWTAGEPIDGLATLSLINGTAADIGGSGGGLFGFGYVDLSGKHDVEPVWTLDCGPYRLESGRPMTSGLNKSGGSLNDGPDADFFRTFLTGPIVRLPAGDWAITAVAHFVEGAGCTGQTHLIRATIPIHVLPAAADALPSSPSGPTSTPPPVADSINGISFERPPAWVRTQPNRFSPANDGPLIYLSTDPVLPTCATPVGQPVNSPDAKGRACDWPMTSLSPSGVLVTWLSTRILQPIPTSSPVIPINGGSTSLAIEHPGACSAIGADETITATIPIGQPTPVSNLAVVACLRGPDLAAGEAQVGAMLESAVIGP